MEKEFEKILELIEQKTIQHRDSISFFNECGIKFISANKAKEIVQEVSEEYNGGWIPCSERLPKLDGTYICTCQGIAESITLIFSTHDNSWSDEFESEYDDVIAWQQLPKPFKECD